MLFKVGICPENFQLDQIQNGRLLASIDFNVLTIIDQGGDFEIYRLQIFQCISLPETVNFVLK